MIDLEVYSKMTSVLTVLSGATYRIGFYLDTLFWSKGFYTHSIFLNRFSGIYHFYDEIAKMLGSPLASHQECRRLVLKTLKVPNRLPTLRRNHSVKRIVCGTGCSELSSERMLTGEQWIRIINHRMRQFQKSRVEIVFIGGKEDRKRAQDISAALKCDSNGVRVFNCCGDLTVNDSLYLLSSADEYWGIDSSLLHYARLFCLKSVSFWGPTHPETLLRPIPDLEEEIFYTRVPCSPCVHLAVSPPCGGNNICMKNLNVEGELDVRLKVGKKII